MKRAALIALAFTCALLGAAGRRAEAKGCHEVSDVVGYQKCSFFGTWSREAAVAPVWLELGFQSHHFRSAPFTLDPQPLLARAAGTDLATTSAAPTMRMLVGTLLYGGFELGGGWLSHTPPASGIVPVASSTYLEGALIAGAHVAVWRVAFGAELAAGGRVTQFSPCASNKCGQTPESQSRWQLEARARIDAFIAPRFSIGLSVGRSLIDANDTTYVVNLGAHIRAIDGMP